MYKKIFIASMLSVCVSQQALAFSPEAFIKENPKTANALGFLFLAALGVSIWACTESGHVLFGSPDSTLQGYSFRDADGNYYIISEDGKEAFQPNEYKHGLWDKWYSFDGQITPTDNPELLGAFNADADKDNGFTYNGVNYTLDHHGTFGRDDFRDIFVVGDPITAPTDATIATNAETTSSVTEKNLVDDAGSTTETVNTNTNTEHTSETDVGQDGTSSITVDEATTSTKTVSTNPNTEQNTL